MAVNNNLESKIYKFLPFILMFMAFMLYANTLDNDFTFDDNSQILENELVKKGTDGISELMQTSYRHGYWSEKATLYRPLSMIMFAVEWEFWPDNPWPGHFFNVLLYAFIIALFFLTVKQFFNNSDGKILLPLIATLIFLFHPIHTEVVANIKSRDEILSMLFGLMQIFLFLKYWDQGRKKKYLILSVIAFALALLSKESSVLFSVFHILGVLMFRDITLKKDWKLTLPYVFIFSVYLVVRYSVLDGLEAVNSVSVLDNFLVGADSNIAIIINAFQVLGAYLFKLIIPINLISDASLNHFEDVGFFDWRFLLAFVIHVSLIILSIRYIKKFPLLSFFGLSYLVSIIFISNILFITGTGYGERLLFVPSMFIALVVAYGFSRIVKVKKFQKISYVVLMSAIFIYGGITINRNNDWDGNQKLFEADLQKSPDNAKLNTMLAMEYIQMAKLKSNKANAGKLYIKAEELLNKAIEIYPEYYGAYERLGMVCFMTNRINDAIKFYKYSIELNQSYARAYSNLGIIYFNNQDFASAIDVYSKAIKYDSKFADAYQNLASAYGASAQKMGVNELDKAEEYLNKSIKYFRICIQLDADNSTSKQFLEMSQQHLNNLRNYKKSNNL